MGIHLPVHIYIKFLGPSWFRKWYKWFYSFQPMFRRANLFGIEVRWEYTK